MSDDRRRRRDTPTGIGPGRGGAGQAPRGAGLSGNLPAGSRFGKHDAPGASPISVQNEPPARVRQPAPAQEREPHGPWESSDTPSRPAVVEPRAVRSPPPPPSPSRAPTTRGAVDGFAATRPAEAVSARAAHASPAPRAGEHKPSLRLKLDSADPEYYEPRAVRVPKQRAPLLLGILIVLAMLGGGAFLWIDAHGGVDNFVAQLRHLGDDSAPAPATTAQPPVQQPSAAEAPAQAPQPPVAAATPEKPATAEQAAAPQVATGEVEQPAAAEQAPKAAEAKPTPPPAAAPKPAVKPVKPAAPREPVVKRAPVHRDPVLRISPLGEGDVLRAPPPDPSGAPVLPPPDPPAPE